jgi:hypothetical protein
MRLTHVTDKRGDSEVHKAGCSHTQRRAGRNHYFEFEAQSRAEALEVLDAQGAPVKFAPCIKGELSGSNNFNEIHLDKPRGLSYYSFRREERKRNAKRTNN